MSDKSDSLGTRAYLRDKEGNVYTADQLFLAMLMKTKVTKRDKKHEDEIGDLLDKGDLF